MYNLISLAPDSITRNNCPPWPLWRSLSNIWPASKSQLVSGRILRTPKLILLLFKILFLRMALGIGTLHRITFSPRLSIFFILLIPLPTLLGVTYATGIMALTKYSPSRVLTLMSLKTSGANVITNGIPFGSSLYMKECVASYGWFEDWLFTNLKIQVKHPIFNIPWNVLFAYMLSHAGKRRNESLQRCAMQCGDHSSPEPAPSEWINANTDGAVASSGSTSFGGVFRDHHGSFISGFAKNLGSTSITAAGLWGVLHGLQLAWSYGFEKLHVQIDSADAYQLIEMASPNSPYPMIRSMAELLNRA
ncbi:hypothetical protein F3Y22_tig00110429pilonHSYRG00606 [Hibiscus syriacus]|uniref:RNase H type-1 domain-containing protein n=1 Tax=Hibiscus syriacus TaxID=106335 RepID=A0A6A3AL38_HIBSY|nr:hypothetical protein F3Y22_tig00110429pilonHSYRG00606 [Hibiscus syriacus]